MVDNDEYEMVENGQGRLMLNDVAPCGWDNCRGELAPRGVVQQGFRREVFPVELQELNNTKEQVVEIVTNRAGIAGFSVPRIDQIFLPWMSGLTSAQLLGNVCMIHQRYGNYGT